MAPQDTDVGLNSGRASWNKVQGTHGAAAERPREQCSNWRWEEALEALIS